MRFVSSHVRQSQRAFDFVVCAAPSSCVQSAGGRGRGEGGKGGLEEGGGRKGEEGWRGRGREEPEREESVGGVGERGEENDREEKEEEGGRRSQEASAARRCAARREEEAREAMHCPEEGGRGARSHALPFQRSLNLSRVSESTALSLRAA
eukprot:2043670-Rhodomonas_salina.1